MISNEAKTPLNELIELETDARAFGFDWPHQTMIIEQALSECIEVQDAIAHQESRERVQEEIGDVIHTALSFCIFSGFDIDETLDKVNQKFGARMAALKQITKEKGLENLQGQSIEYMIELWREAKVRAKK